jgi:hypothetical protein
MQAVIVGAVVSLALVHVVWTLMPAGGRQRLARWLLARAAPGGGGWRATWRQWLRQHGRAGCGCGCSGCEAGAGVTIRIHRQPPKN